MIVSKRRVMLCHAISWPSLDNVAPEERWLGVA